MKSLLSFFFAFFSLCLQPGLAAPAVSAKQALATLSRSQGQAVASRVVFVSATRGQHQPESWKFVTRDSQGSFVEFLVTANRVAGSRPIPGFAVGEPISPKRLSVDSTTAFLLAEKASRKAKLGFDSVSYELRCAELSDKPVWFLTLVDLTGNKVGQVTVAGNSETILRKSFDTPNVGVQATPQPAPRPQPQPAPNYYPPSAGHPYAYQQAEPGLWDQTKSAVNQGGHVLKTGAVQTGKAVKGWLNKLTGRNQSDYYYDNLGQ